MAVPLLIALKTIAEIGAAVQAVNGAYNFFEDKVKDVDKSQIILETVRHVAKWLNIRLRWKNRP